MDSNNRIYYLLKNPVGLLYIRKRSYHNKQKDAIILTK